MSSVLRRFPVGATVKYSQHYLQGCVPDMIRINAKKVGKVTGHSLPNYSSVRVVWDGKTDYPHLHHPDSLVRVEAPNVPAE